MLDFVLEKVENLAHKLTTKLQAKVLCLMKLVKQLGKQVVTSHLQKERHDHTSMSWHSKDKSNLTGKNYDRQNYTNYTKKRGGEIADRCNLKERNGGDLLFFHNFFPLLFSGM